MLSSNLENHTRTSYHRPYFIRIPLDQGNYTRTIPVPFETTDSTVPIRWCSLLLAAFMILGAAGNCMVCIAIFTDRRLQSVTNYFLFSLAIADLLVSLLVMPFSILTELHHGNWHYGFILCACYSYADVFLCSASIVHMSIISLDRYLGISRPLKTRNKSKLVVILKIILVWIITTTISCPIAVLAIVNPSDIYKDHLCAIDNAYFMIYGSTLAFLIPCLVMVATYVRTTQLLRRQALLCSSRTSSCRSQDGTVTGPVIGLRRTRTRRKLDANRQNSCEVSRKFSPSIGGSSSNETPRITLRRCITAKAMNLNEFHASCAQIESRDQVMAKMMKLSKSSNDAKMMKISKSSDESLNNFENARTCTKTISKNFRQKTITFFRTTKRSSTATELANEQKATRVLGLVFGCFVVCWTPFFVQNFTTAFCGHKCQIPAWLSSTFVWLGYLSSTINPIIYTTFNKRFRQAFANIIKCRCLDSKAKKRHSRSASSAYSANNHTYHHGSFTSGQVTCPSPGQFVDTYRKCNIHRIPPDFIAENAAESERLYVSENYII